MAETEWMCCGQLLGDLVWRWLEGGSDGSRSDWADVGMWGTVCDEHEPCRRSQTRGLKYGPTMMRESCQDTHCIMSATPCPYHLGGLFYSNKVKVHSNLFWIQACVFVTQTWGQCGMCSLKRISDLQSLSNWYVCSHILPALLMHAKNTAIAGCHAKGVKEWGSQQRTSHSHRNNDSSQESLWWCSTARVSLLPAADHNLPHFPSYL